MDTMSAISTRRSIRKFDPKPVPRELIEQILQAGVESPSAKNRQPWHFVIVTDGGDKLAMLQAMRSGLEWMDQNGEFDPALMKGAWYTLGIMEQAPVTVFILNEEGKTPFMGLEPFGERFMELANVQSVGACIQNMCLAATDLGLGSLWICDVFQAYHTLIEWLGTDAELVAALSIGYALEQPQARPRKPLSEVTTWR